MPVKVWKTDGLWCARWGEGGKRYCGKNKASQIQRALKQAAAIYASGYKSKKKGR